MTISVAIRKATHQTGYLLSVTRSNGKGGGTTFPGPPCSTLKTAREVADWICLYLPDKD